MLAAKLKNVQDILDANEVAKKVKSATVKLTFQHLGTTKNWVYLVMLSWLTCLMVAAKEEISSVFLEKMVKHPHYVGSLRKLDELLEAL